MKRVLITGFYADYLYRSIEELERDQHIEIVKWVVADEHPQIIHRNKLWWWDLVFNVQVPPVRLSEEDSLFVMENMWWFKQHMVREKLFELDDSYEIQNIIFKFIYYFKSIFESEKIDAVLFSDVPHGAYDLLIYKIAKRMKIRTLFCMPSFWPGKTFIYENLEEIGRLKNLSEEKINIAEDFHKTLPYMKKPTLKASFKKKTSILWNFSEVVKEKKADFTRNQILYGNLKYYIGIHLQRWLKRSIANNQYRKLYRDMFIDTIHEGEKFVYFPLHLQPEMTTDTLGKIYFDQILAIEQLRKIIPKDWMIYVKENPKQTSYMRGKRFFSRLKSVPNVRLLGKDIDTYSIMEKCQFVSTITGTAGWEAITGGKHTLIFGLAWYKNFPGVTIYRDDITIEEILSKNIEHNKIEQYACALVKEAYNFYVNDYHRAYSKFDDNENMENLKEALIEVL